MKLVDLLNDEYAPLRMLKEKAHLQFRLSLTRWSEHLGRDPVLTDLQPLPVQQFVAARRARVSTATALKDRVHVVALWNHAARRRLVDQFPTLPPLRAPKRIPRAYRLEEVSALVRTARALDGTVAGLPRGLWWATLLRSCWETGERCGSHWQLRWEDVDLDRGTVTFRAETRKGGSRDIQRAISHEQVAWLRQLRAAGRAGLVWPWELSHCLLWRHLKLLALAAGVPHRGFHGLRRASASYLAAAGGNATEHLSHSSPTLARDHYLDPSIARGQSALDYLPALDLGPGLADVGQEPR